MPITAAIYARYSSDSQSEKSIEDQVRVCRARAEQNGWTVTEVYADYALSGATTNRPQLQLLLSEARRRGFDFVVTEALDRVSRDQEHTARVYKELTFAGVKLVTLSEGEISELHVGMKGTMNALFLKDLAAKTHRGLTGRVMAGKSGGGLSYGYSMVRNLNERGEVDRGDRAIHPVEGQVVRRIFAMFAEGSSPIAIAKRLNAEGIAGPRGRPWKDTTIRGDSKRGAGILRNQLYIGRIVWNRTRFVRDPATGKRVWRPNAPDAWTIKEVPHLRVVDDEMWLPAQARLESIREASGANDPMRPKFWKKRRAGHVLTGKVFCGTCGGTFSNGGRNYLSCGAAKRQGVCDNRWTIPRPDLEDLVLTALRTQLMDPVLVDLFVKEFIAEWNRLQAETDAGRAQQEQELGKVERKLAQLIDAISEGLRAPSLQKQLDDLEKRRAALEAELAAPVALVPLIHPNLAPVYRKRVEGLHEALRRDPEGREALELVRSLIDRVTVTPRPDGDGMDIDITGAIAAMIELGMAEKRQKHRVAGASGADMFLRSAKVVAGTRNHRQLTPIRLSC